MQLTEQQSQSVREWVAAGLSLADVQQNLKTEYGITMTFMDVRLLVLDLGAAVKDKPEPKEKAPVPPMPQHVIEDEEGLPEDDQGAGMDASDTSEEPMRQDGEAPIGTSLFMTMDSLVVPGAMLSGNVTFSDGTKARWLIDQYGRLGIEPDTPGYRPSPEDLKAFELQLRSELQRKGYM
jgi:hypothetical protein